LYRCKNKDCKKTFPIPARITSKPLGQFTSNTLIEKVCCPHCLCIDIEEVKETTT